MILAIDKVDWCGLSNTACCEHLTQKEDKVDTVLAIEGDILTA